MHWALTPRTPPPIDDTFPLASIRCINFLTCVQSEPLWGVLLRRHQLGSIRSHVREGEGGAARQ